MSSDAQLLNGESIKLGKVEKDISGIEIIRYVAPIILVKLVDENGNLINDYNPILRYTQSEKDGERVTTYLTGSNVDFESQPDGRWRSKQLLPNEPFTVTVEKEGYRTSPQKLSLAEGEVKEIDFILVKESEVADETDRDAYENGFFNDKKPIQR